MKKIYLSKTVWFNGVMTLVAVVPVIASAAKIIKPESALIIDTVAGVVITIGNAVLRIWFTEVPIDTPKSRAKMMGAASFRR